MNYYYITKLHLIVSDEEIKIDDNYLALETYYSDGDKWIKYVKVTRLNGTKQHKIIAGIDELPSINIINQQDKDRLGWIDVYKHYQEDSFELGIDGHSSLTAYTCGFNKALSTKRYSEEDIIKVIEYCRYNRAFDYIDEEIIKSLDQPELIPIEIKKESNQITITKIL